MKYLAAALSLVLCSCYRTNFATTGQTARISGKMAAFHTFMLSGESHTFISKIDHQLVRGTRTFTVDAGKRVIEANFTGAGGMPGVSATPGMVIPGTYTGGTAILTPVLEAGHTYKVQSGTSASSRTAFVYDITDGNRKMITSAPIQGH